MGILILRSIPCPRMGLIAESLRSNTNVQWYPPGLGDLVRRIVKDCKRSYVLSRTCSVVTREEKPKAWMHDATINYFSQVHAVWIELPKIGFIWDSYALTLWYSSDVVNGYALEASSWFLCRYASSKVKLARNLNSALKKDKFWQWLKHTNIYSNGFHFT